MQNTQLINVDLGFSSDILLIDVRSPGEYKQAHIPGAINIPLLNDNERVAVGITYKKAGNTAAVELGFKLVGKKFHQKILKTKLELAKNNKTKITIYCWRGGLRSNIFLWLLKTAGLDAELIPGGYKAYRNKLLTYFEKPLTLIALSGKTGSGKTKLLTYCKQLNEAVIDLEGLANHRGSAFGGIGLKKQPTQEMFENLLALELIACQNRGIVFVENESRRIGKLIIPLPFFEQLTKSKVIVLETTLDYRINEILKTYGKYKISLLKDATQTLVKRLGIERTAEAIHALENDNKVHWLTILFDYYDKSYAHSFDNNQQSIMGTLNTKKVRKQDALTLIQLAKPNLNA